MVEQYGLYIRVGGSTSLNLHIASAFPVEENDAMIQRFMIRLAVGRHIHTAMAAGICAPYGNAQAAAIFAAQAAYREIWADIRDCPDLPSGLRDLMTDMGRLVIEDEQFGHALANSLAMLQDGTG